MKWLFQLELHTGISVRHRYVYQLTVPVMTWYSATEIYGRISFRRLVATVSCTNGSSLDMVFCHRVYIYSVAEYLVQLVDMFQFAVPMPPVTTWYSITVYDNCYHLEYLLSMWYYQLAVMAPVITVFCHEYMFQCFS